MSWKNFHIWRGRLPHWRADDVVYYVTFRHGRALESKERDDLLRALTRPSIGRPSIAIACVLPDKTELMCMIGTNVRGATVELSQSIEKTKSKVGRAIMKRTGERFPPFYGESYDRIVRDQAEYEERWEAILASPVEAGLADEPDLYPYLFVSESPTGVRWDEDLEADDPPAQPGS